LLILLREFPQAIVIGQDILSGRPTLAEIARKHDIEGGTKILYEERAAAA